MIATSLAPLFSWSYWFTYYPSAFAGSAFWLVVGAAGVGVVGGIVLWFSSKGVNEPTWRKIMRRVAKLGITVGLLVWLSFFFTQTYTPLFGNRFWFLLWGLMALVWLAFIVRYAIWIAPQERTERAKQQEYKKYLPSTH